MLTIDSGGLWRVRTHTAVYTLDLTGEERWALRVQLDAEEVEADYEAGPLRNDGRSIPLISVEGVVGQPLRMLLLGLADGCTTLRSSTPVVEIKRLPEPLDAWSDGVESSDAR